MLINLRKISISKKLTADDKILIALLAPFYSAIINSTIVFMLQIETSHPGFALFRNVSILIIGLLFLYALPTVLKREALFTGIIVSLLIILLALTLLIFPNNIPFLFREGVLIYTFSVTMPCFIYAYCVRNIEKLYRYLEVYAAFVIAVCCLILSSMVLFSFGINNSYSMSLGYSAAMASIIYLYKLFIKQNMKDLVLFIIGLSLIIYIGSRGPLLCITVFPVAYFVLKMMQGKTTKRGFMNFSIFLLSLAFISYALINRDWLVGLNHILSGFNINSRTLLLLINDSISQSSGRNEVYSFLLQKIKEQPLLGYGIGSDRMMVGMYAHNLFLALFTFFGLIGGILSSLVIIFILLGAFVAAKDQKTAVILVILFSIYFVSSMLSGDILTSYGLWILIGVSLKAIFSKIRFMIKDFK